MPTINSVNRLENFLPTREWSAISRPAAAAWVIFYAGFLVYAFREHGAFLVIDFANLVVHEGGHMMFGWFGPTLGIWGGTILQWSVPALLAGYFFFERQLAAYTFCIFFFFENMLYTATYMADARDMALPLVSAGGSDYVEHDWHTIFTRMGVLQYDTLVAGIVRTCGWFGMLAVVVWMCWKSATAGFSKS